MTTTNKPTQRQATPGFAVPLEGNTQLGTAMLIAEDETGGYRPIGLASTIAEARELAAKDLDGQNTRAALGEVPYRPEAYRLWANGLDGFAVAATFSNAL